MRFIYCTCQIQDTGFVPALEAACMNVVKTAVEGFHGYEPALMMDSSYIKLPDSPESGS